jgi:SAM-dependent methyltransferase
MDKRETYTVGYSDVALRYMMRRHAARDAALLLPWLKPGMTLLDCGCGPGTITVGLAKAVVPGRVVGIDLEESQFETAQQIARERGATNIEWKAASIYQLPFPDNSFDVVFSHALFEHLGEPEAALQEISRVLRPDGLVALSSPDWSGNLMAPRDPEAEKPLRSTKRFNNETAAILWPRVRAPLRRRFSVSAWRRSMIATRTCRWPNSGGSKRGWRRGGSRGSTEAIWQPAIPQAVGGQPAKFSLRRLWDAIGRAEKWVIKVKICRITNAEDDAAAVGRRSLACLPCQSRAAWAELVKRIVAGLPRLSCGGVFVNEEKKGTMDIAPGLGPASRGWRCVLRIAGAAGAQSDSLHDRGSLLALASRASVARLYRVLFRRWLWRDR